MLQKFNSPFGIFIISAIIGLGLAGLFRRACKGEKCEKVKGPRLAEVQNMSFKVGEKCYTYIPEVVECEDTIQ